MEKILRGWKLVKETFLKKIIFQLSHIGKKSRLVFIVFFFFLISSLSLSPSAVWENIWGEKTSSNACFYLKTYFGKIVCISRISVREFMIMMWVFNLQRCVLYFCLFCLYLWVGGYCIWVEYWISQLVLRGLYSLVFTILQCPFLIDWKTLPPEKRMYQSHDLIFWD